MPEAAQPLARPAGAPRPEAMAPRARAAGRLTWTIALVAAGACVAALLASSHPEAAAASAVVHALFAVPGILLLTRASAAADGWLPIWTFGPLLGQGLSSLTLGLLWSAGGRGAWLVPAAAALAAAPAALPRATLGRWRMAATLPGDGRWLPAILLLVPLLVTWPFSHVGAETAGGKAYRAYFTADYVWRRAVVLELAKGDFLPANPFYAGDVLHYYWLPHLEDAVEYRAVAHDHVDLDDLLLARSVLVDVMFVALLYGFARQFVRRPPAAAGAVAIAVLFTSFEGLYGMWEHWRVGLPIDNLRNFNIDAISRWMLHAMPIDGLQRVLWYQPHHALGYAFGLLGVMALARRRQPDDPMAFAQAGALLGASTLISSFGGLMFTSAAAAHEAMAVVRRRAWGRAVRHAAAAAVPLGLAAITVMALRYVDRGGQVILLGLNHVAVANVVPATFLSFGPVLILGAAAAVVAWRERRRDLGPVAAILGVCVVFYFFVDIRDHQNVYVGWRVGHLTFIASIAGIAVLLERLSTLERRARAGWAALALILAASAPTVLIDLYNTQDIGNRGWTLTLSPAEMAAFEWIGRHTLPADLVQIDPVARDPGSWAYIPAFANRRMFGGLPISMVPLHKYDVRAKRIREIFDLEAPLAYERARSANVRYVWVGEPERGAHPGVDARLDADPTLFQPVFRRDGVTIYGVSRTLGE
jgi:hypothetical protein